MAGNDAGANGCTLPVRLTSDGIAVLCAGKGFTNRNGEYMAVEDLTFSELRTFYNKVITFGQALELGRACAAKLCVMASDMQAVLSARVALKYSEYLENAYFAGLSIQEATKLSMRYPDLNLMMDFDRVPVSAESLVRKVREAGLFGLRAEPALLTAEICHAALNNGLFVASTESTDPEELRNMMERGVNFIETERPDLAYELLPKPDLD